jgi:TRAP-type uncharacterized transport system fused permease subunit
MMAQGSAAVLFIIWILGCITAVVIMLIIFWRAMRAHEAIAGSMKEISEAFQSQARTAVLEAKRDI